MTETAEIPGLSAEERLKLYEGLKEQAMEEAAGAGWAIDGYNPYDDERQLNFSWPENAGIQVGDQWISDNVKAPVDHGTFVIAKQYKKTGRVRASTLRKVQLDGGTIQQIREAAKWDNLREGGYTPDPFAYGSQQAVQGVGGILNDFVPLWPGPVTRQLYWQDYWMMSAKAFEAYNHDPISWRCVHMKAEFALGRGLECKVTKSRGSGKGQSHDQAQQIWDEFWQRNKMDQRMDQIARDYCWSGEQFLRYFKQGRKLTIRSLDPATIYDLITDPEDIESVYAYHQQYQTAYQLYPPGRISLPGGLSPPNGPSQPGATTRYIIRQILPQEIDHYKANSSSGERRGRSDLFPALGWIRRLRDYLTSHVIRADMLSRICWDLEVAGNQQAVQSLRNRLFPGGRAPNPGTVFAHNTASKLQAIVPQAASGGRAGDPILDALVTMVADSIGLPKDWLSFGLQNTRAGALVATEPAAKSLQELQGTLEGIVHDQFRRVMSAALITDAQLEVTFPSIAAEDRKQKLDDLGTMEANGWLAKETAATLGAKEMDITTYDFNEEQSKIAKEFAKPEIEDSPTLLGPDGNPLKTRKRGDGTIRRQVILATKRQAPKLDITVSPSVEDDPAGLAVPLDMPAPDSPDGTGRTVPGGGSHDNGVTRGGAPANENPISRAGAGNIRKDSTNMREAELSYTLTGRQLSWLLAEARAGARKRPEDPEFQIAAEQYRRDSKENLEQLVDSTKR